jgi:hypothetical protein
MDERRGGQRARIQRADVENERERLAALGVWTQAWLGWSQPPRTPKKALVVDQKRKIFKILFF